MLNLRLLPSCSSVPVFQMDIEAVCSTKTQITTYFVQRRVMTNTHSFNLFKLLAHRNSPGIAFNAIPCLGIKGFNIHFLFFPMNLFKSNNFRPYFMHRFVLKNIVGHVLCSHAVALWCSAGEKQQLRRRNDRTAWMNESSLKTAVKPK